MDNNITKLYKDIYACFVRPSISIKPSISIGYYDEEGFVHSGTFENIPDWAVGACITNRFPALTPKGFIPLESSKNYFYLGKEKGCDFLLPNGLFYKKITFSEKQDMHRAINKIKYEYSKLYGTSSFDSAVDNLDLAQTLDIKGKVSIMYGNSPDKFQNGTFEDIPENITYAKVITNAPVVNSDGVIDTNEVTCILMVGKSFSINYYSIPGVSKETKISEKDLKDYQKSGHSHIILTKDGVLLGKDYYYVFSTIEEMKNAIAQMNIVLNMLENTDSKTK